MGARIGLEGNLETPRAEGGDVASDTTDRNACIPFAMNDENLEISASFQSAQGTETGGHPSVNRNDAGESFGKGQTKSISNGSALADTHEENPLGMHVERPAGFSDRRQYVIFEQIHRVGGGTRYSSANDLGLKIKPLPGAEKGGPQTAQPRS